MSMDLFTPVVPEERFHPAFQKILRRPTSPDRIVLNRWAEGFVDRDGKFVKEFQTTFDSSFWELYLHAMFKELGMVCDYQWPRPDFCIESPTPFMVEATVSLQAQGAPAMLGANPLDMPKEFAEFNRQAIIRFSNSLHAKYKKYVAHYSRLAHVSGRPFVVAIAPFDRPHFQLQAERAVEAVLYRYYVDEDAHRRKYPDGGVPLFAEELPHVLKDNGQPLPLGAFCDASMAGISAVIQSTAATWSKVRAMSDDPNVMITAIYENRDQGGTFYYDGPNSRYSEDILDGLRIYHNPYATRPLAPSLFDRPEIFQATLKGPLRLILMNDCRKNLVNRMAITCSPAKMQQVLARMPPGENYWHYPS